MRPDSSCFPFPAFSRQSNTRSYWSLALEQRFLNINMHVNHQDTQPKCRMEFWELGLESSKSKAGLKVSSVVWVRGPLSVAQI